MGYGFNTGNLTAQQKAIINQREREEQLRREEREREERERIEREEKSEE